ncbi:BBE domain-containing protein [Hymenobacter tibetensis]
MLGPHDERLRAVKKKQDPTNFYRFNQNILSAA